MRGATESHGLRRHAVWLALLLAVVMTGGVSTAEVWVQGYYVGYNRGDLPPSAIDFGNLTHIIIGPALPVVGGTWDTTFYIGADGPAWAQDVIARAHAAGKKALLMLGGAGSTNIANFRTVSDPTIRAAFVANLKTIIDSYGFDGFDVDWEPLALSGTNDDRARFLAFTQDLRAAMPDAIMTIPVGWNNSNFDSQENPYFGTISAYYDRVNMMSYGMVWFGSGWQSWHSSALYGETSTTPSSVSDTVRALLVAGVPREKIGIGMGFYGTVVENGSWVDYAWTPKTSPPYVTAPHQSTEEANARISDNYASYSNILRLYHEESARRWDDTAKAAYLSWETPKEISEPTWATPPIATTYVTYEDTQSIAEKGAYVNAQGLGGTIIWTISEGYLEWLTSGEKDPLMKMTKSAFLGNGFVPLTPCRVLDTRVSEGTSAAAPELGSDQRRLFTVANRCGIPVGARAISTNVTVVGAQAEGNLRVIGGHLASTVTSALSIPLTRARANNAVIQLATTDSGQIAVTNSSSGTVHFILDVNGYFM
jgi:chitinase